VPGGTIQTRTTAVGAMLTIKKLRQLFPHSSRFSFAKAPLKIRNDTLKAVPLFDLHATRVLVKELNFFATTTEQNDVPQLLTQLIERCLQIEVVVRRGIIW